MYRMDKRSGGSPSLETGGTQYREGAVPGSCGEVKAGMELRGRGGPWVPGGDGDNIAKTILASCQGGWRC